VSVEKGGGGEQNQNEKDGGKGQWGRIQETGGQKTDGKAVLGQKEEGRTS